MVKSMTGFGAGEYDINDMKIMVELKSVNHRYCDVNVKIPRRLSFLENDVRTYVKKKLSRGKIDAYISYDDNCEKSESLKFDEVLAKEYMQYFNYISDTFNLENDIKVSTLTRYPDVLKLEEQEDDRETLWSILKGALDGAIDVMIKEREVEGELLKKDILMKLENMTVSLEAIKEKSPLVVAAYKDKLLTRINELLDKPDLDESRLALEVAIFADKSCIDEEIVRLESHIEHTKQLFNTTEPVGRKLDFLAQEMNREANTILSKANDIDISNVALELKTDIEKIREQIQNIE
jgi:uncharacterized protein (TIGR00255 family)